MAWAVVAGAAIGAVGSYVSAKSSNNAAAKANKGAGQVDVTTTRTGDPNADPYRNFGMQQAAYAAYGYDPASGDHYTPANQATQQQADTTDPRQAWRQQRRTAAKAPAAGSSSTPAAPAPKPFAGMSDQTDQIRTSMMGLPQQNQGMYDTSEKYLTDTLGGTERNAYRSDAADAAHAISDDPSLTEYQNAIKRQLGIGNDSGGSGGGIGGPVQPINENNRAALVAAYNPGGSLAGGGGGGGNSYGTSATGTDAALRALVAGGKPAGWDEMQQGISDQVAATRASNLRELKAQGVGSGFYGGDYYSALAQGASAQGDKQLSDSLAAARFGAYQNALGLGEQYDTSMADIAARERASNASSSASAGAASAALDQQKMLALYGDWGSSIGMGQQGRTASAGALGDLAHLTSADQQAAIQGIDNLGTSRRNDLGAAGQLSLGSDEARNSYISSQNQLKASLANTNMQRGVANANLGWAQQQFYDPLNRTLAYGNALGLFYGGLGSETTQGSDRRNSSPAPYANVAGAGLQGAALGAQVGGLYQNYSSGTGARANTPSGGLYDPG